MKAHHGELLDSLRLFSQSKTINQSHSFRANPKVPGSWFDYRPFRANMEVHISRISCVHVGKSSNISVPKFVKL